MVSKLNELLQYRQMLKSLVSSDLRTRYKGSVLGFLWTFINPLLLLLVYTVVFSTIMRINIDHYTVFLFIGLLPWIYFQTSVQNSSNVIVRNANLIKKIYFPREVLPISVVLGGLANYLFGLIILIPALYIAGLSLTWNVIYFPFILLIQTVLILSVALIVSSLTVYFRDLEHILSIIIMAWFYLTPVIYPTTFIPLDYQKYFHLNPLKPIIEAYQSIFYYQVPPDIKALMGIFIYSIVFLIFSAFIFEKLNKRFAEEV
jgi:lipopolysaccharide transport system permease protein